MVTEVFVLGTRNMLENKHLKLDEKGEGQLHFMHEFVVPGLAKLDGSGKNLIQRWADREAKNGYQYFAYYQHEGDQIKSIITGVVYKDGNMAVMNTATLPELRKQGFIENGLYGLIVDIAKEESFKTANLAGSLSTGVDSRKLFTNAEEAKKAVAEINAAGFRYESSGLEVAGVLSDHAKIAFNAMKESNLWKKDNFAVMNAISEKLSSASKPKMEFVVGGDTGNINLSPTIAITKELVTYCEQKLAIWKSANKSHSSSSSSTPSSYVTSASAAITKEVEKSVSH